MKIESKAIVISILFAALIISGCFLIEKNKPATNEMNPAVQKNNQGAIKDTSTTTTVNENKVYTLPPINLFPEYQNNTSNATAKIGQTIAVNIVSIPNFYTPIYDSSILTFAKQYTVPPKVVLDKNGEPIVGSLGTTTFEFTPIKSGNTEITFRDAHDPSDTASEITVNISVVTQ